jgi:hypothetical protein
MARKCRYYYELGPYRAKAREWLKKNPPPRNYDGSAWRWAFEHMER